MCGGTTVNAPAVDPNQQALEQAQLKELQGSQDQINGFMPFVLQQYGLQDSNTLTQEQRDQLRPQLAKQQQDLAYWQGLPDSDPGKAQGLQSTQTYIDQLNSQINPNYQKTDQQKANDAQLLAVQQQNLAIQKANNDRVQSALNGTLPANAAIEQQKQKDFAVLQQDQENKGNGIVGDSLDNAVAKTTSGEQALQALKQSYAALSQNYVDSVIAGGASTQGQFQSQYSVGQGQMNPGAPNVAGNLQALTGAYSSAYQPYLAQSQLQYNADATNATNRTNMITGLIGAGLNAGGRAAGAAASA